MDSVQPTCPLDRARRIRLVRIDTRGGGAVQTESSRALPYRGPEVVQRWGSTSPVGAQIAMDASTAVGPALLVGCLAMLVAFIIAIL